MRDFISREESSTVCKEQPIVDEVSLLILWSENLGFLWVPICLCSYPDLSFVITNICNGVLPLSNISLLGDYAFGSGNSKQQIPIPHSWEVAGLYNCATPVNQQLKGLVKLLSWRCKNKLLDRLEDIRAWPGRFSNIHN